MKCLKCGMAHYAYSCYDHKELDYSCPVCGHYPWYGKRPNVIVNSMPLNEAPLNTKRYDGTVGILEGDTGCRWWEGILPDGRDKDCFNCGWSECVCSNQTGRWSKYMDRDDSKGASIIYPEGHPDLG